MTTKLTAAAAGSTAHAVRCIQSLAADERFVIELVITPAPQPQGRNKDLVRNPVHQWAEDHRKPVLLIEDQISNELKQPLSEHFPNSPDFLLVVDFGYLIPNWLLSLPKIAPINVHPSALPRWRGSSPAQFAILNGDQTSAVSVMKLDEQLDHGPLVFQEGFSLNPNWTSADYYHYSFELIAPKLPSILEQLAQNKIKPEPQPDQSPTPVARKINKSDSFVSWEIVKFCRNKLQRNSSKQQLLAALPKDSILKKFIAKKDLASWPQVVERACRAFQPWPIVWTKIPTSKGPRRMQLLKCQIKSQQSNSSQLTTQRPNKDLAQNSNQKIILELDQVKVAGQQAAAWNQVKNIVIAQEDDK